MPSGQLQLVSSERVFGVPAKRGRWAFIGLGLLTNICLGAVYSFSVFKAPLVAQWGISATASSLPYMIALAFFSLFMAVSGPWIKRWGPRRIGFVGAAVVGVGWLLSSLSPNIWVLTLSYGVVSGAGVGILYGCPMAIAAHWFPDRRGFAVGMTVLGFGISPLLTAPLMSSLIESIGVMPSFAILGGVFLVVLMLLVSLFEMPDEGWRPPNWTPPVCHERPHVDLDRKAMLKTGTFYALWGTFAIGSLAGLMAIGISRDFGTEVVRLQGSLATTAVAFFAIFNGVGRPLFGWLTDRLSTRMAATISFTLILSSSAILYFLGEGNTLVYFVAFGLLWLNLGGWLAIAPAATAKLFGADHYVQNYAVIFSAYGVGAILGSILSGLIRDTFGSYLPVFLPVMGLAVLGIVISLTVLRPVANKQGS